MPAATTKVHKLNYKGNLDWLKGCSGFFYNLSEENEYLHHRLSTARKDPMD